ncbi:hypothetical protein [Actinophytocola sp. KF-1]
MEQAETVVLTTVRHPDSATAEKWFALLCRAYRQVEAAGTRSVPEVLAAIRAEWTSDSDLEAFQRALDGLSSPWETLGKLVEYDTRLPAEYAAAVQAAAAQAPAPVDPAAWHRFFAEHGPRWNGTEQAWDQFRTWFLYQAGQAGVTAAATGFLTEAENGEKIAVFARHGVRIAPPQTADPAAWHRFFAAHGPRWNGTEQAWDQFRTWFLYQADQAGVTAAATGFLTEAENGDKIAVFARHGVTIAAPAAAAPAAQAPSAEDGPGDAAGDEPAVTELRWVTAQQIESLGELEETLGPWESWLPEELDGRIPGWTALSPDTLVERLDAMIPFLVLPAADALEDVATDMTEKLQQLAQDDPEVAELLSEMDREELGELIEEALTPQN